MEITEALRTGVKYLKNSLYTDKFYEVRYILSFLLNKDISYLIAHGDDILNKKIENEYFNILSRRKDGEPLQYIIGKTEFYGREFIINKNVLIPREDTETSINALKCIIEDRKLDVLEIGSGSGIVSVTMALECPINSYTACDISKDALENTLLNVEKYNLENIKVISSDLFSNINGKFDIIYSNPPYIKKSEIDKLQIEVKKFEPVLALDGGEDGLDFYRAIISKVGNYLKENGYLVFEIGHNQFEDIKVLLKEYNSVVIKDLAQKDRVVVASKGEIDVRKFRCI